MTMMDNDDDEDGDGDGDGQRVHTAKFLCSRLHCRLMSDNKLCYYTNLVFPAHRNHTASVIVPLYET